MANNPRYNNRVGLYPNYKVQRFVATNEFVGGDMVAIKFNNTGTLRENASTFKVVAATWSGATYQSDVVLTSNSFVLHTEVGDISLNSQYAQLSDPSSLQSYIIFVVNTITEQPVVGANCWLVFKIKQGCSLKLESGPYTTFVYRSPYQWPKQSSALTITY